MICRAEYLEGDWKCAEADREIIRAHDAETFVDSEHDVFVNYVAPLLQQLGTLWRNRVQSARAACFTWSGGAWSRRAFVAAELASACM